MSRHFFSRLISDYGMAFVLLLLCIYYSWATLKLQASSGSAGAADCAQIIRSKSPRPARVLVVAGASSEDREFASSLTARLQDAGIATVRTEGADPRLARAAIQSMVDAGNPPNAIAATDECARWLPNLLQRLPSGRALSTVPITTPGSYRWPTFLQADNIRNVANQIVVIAVIAVGMTLVIITGGIDLSVGSLVALSAVVAGILIRDRAGGMRAGTASLILCCAAAVAASGAIGAFSGAMVTIFRVPSFIATLGVMQVASGLAYILSAGQSIYDIPQSFVWLGRGVGLLGIPNAVILMLGLYVSAHILMSQTRLGRYIYAAGGNAEAARLSGVRVGAVLMIVYTLSGLAAGLSGVILASQLKSSSPTYGLSYELYVIAAVVVGGTSLAGGSGKVFGTLIGALIIAVIQNGMNLTGVESYRQKVVLGMVILVAVLLDMLKNRPRKLPVWLRRRHESTTAPPVERAMPG